MLKSSSRDRCALRSEAIAEAYRRMVGRWLVRLALSADRCLRKVAEDSSEASRVRAFIGLRRHAGLMSRKRAAELLRTRLAAMGAGGEGEFGQTPLMRNIAILARLVELTHVEQQLLAFMVWLKTCHELREVAGGILCGNNSEMIGLIASTLAVERNELKPAFDKTGALIDTGLLAVMDGLMDLGDKVVVREGLEDVLLDERATEAALVGNFFDLAGDAELEAADFRHQLDELRLVSEYLRGAYREKLLGVNVLLYGPPGTGKTEFAKVLARAVGKRLYSVRNADVDGDAASALQRLGSYRLCQRFLMRSGSGMVLFDEIEDVFPPDGSDERRVSKAWMNGMLEFNPIPAIWISNSIERVDRAYLRRFDYSVRFGGVSKVVRVRALRRHLSDLNIKSAVLDKLANWPDTTVAQMERAGKVVRAIQLQGGAANGHVIRRVLGRSAELLGQQVEGDGVTGAGELDLGFTNADINPALLVERLGRVSGPISLCFYGPSGTGKTTLAQHIARELGRPLHLKRASDVLSCWVGVAEQQIGQIFERAELEGAVLFLDEADGLLADRGRASRGWEITQVNELLSRMERFKGVFICATNLLDWFDEAAFRRFEFKIRFDYLNAAQKGELLRREYQGLKRDEERCCLAMLEGVANLAVGDVATVRRRAVVMGEHLSPYEFVARLKKECAFKRHQPERKIGFTA